MAPTIAIVAPSDSAAAELAVTRASSYDWIVFTSANGVRAFFDNLHARREDARSLGRARIAAIGAKTAGALAALHVFADLVPQSYIAEDLARALIAAGKQHDAVLLYGAEQARDVLAQRLREAGRRVDAVPAYRTVTLEDPALGQKLAACDIVTFTSASAVRGFVQNLGGPDGARAAAAGKSIACIGPVTAREAAAHGLHVAVTADEFTVNGLVDALERSSMRA